MNERISLQKIVNSDRKRFRVSREDFHRLKDEAENRDKDDRGSYPYIRVVDLTDSRSGIREAELNLELEEALAVREAWHSSNDTVYFHENVEFFPVKNPRLVAAKQGALRIAYYREGDGNVVLTNSKFVTTFPETLADYSPNSYFDIWDKPENTYNSLVQSIRDDLGEETFEGIYVHTPDIKTPISHHASLQRHHIEIQSETVLQDEDVIRWITSSFAAIGAFPEHVYFDHHYVGYDTVIGKRDRTFTREIEIDVTDRQSVFIGIADVRVHDVREESGKVSIRLMNGFLEHASLAEQDFCYAFQDAVNSLQGGQNG